MGRKAGTRNVAWFQTVTELKKVKQPHNFDEWECPRCLQHKCGKCVKQHKVEFEVMDSKEGSKKQIQWKGLIVCPWCYNQLVEKVEK